MSRWRRSPRARRAQIARNAAGVIAVELIAAAQGIDYHAPLKTSAKLQAVHAGVRERSPHLVSDRYWADEMAALQAAVLAGEIGAEIRAQLTRGPALFLAEHSGERAAPHIDRVGADLADRGRGADVALGVERLALEQCRRPPAARPTGCGCRPGAGCRPCALSPWPSPTRRSPCRNRHCRTV